MDDTIERLLDRTSKVISIGYKNYGNGTIHIPLKPNKTFKSYLALIRLWKLFLEIADETKKHNIDEYRHYNPFKNVYTG
jgi:hypothetical protein